jgi:hypothetical protein
MPYQLVLSEPTTDPQKDVGENVFLDNLPDKYKVYLLYYSGSSPNNDLESRLRRLGKDTGTNLFVNISKINDPHYRKIVNKFGIKGLPAIVITGIDELAAAKEEPATAYVRLDSPKLMDSPDSVMECVEKIFNLYIQGEVAKAMSRGARTQFLGRLKEIILVPLKGIKGFLKEWEISISLITGTLTLKPKQDE